MKIRCRRQEIVLNLYRGLGRQSQVGSSPMIARGSRSSEVTAEVEGGKQGDFWGRDMKVGTWWAWDR